VVERLDRFSSRPRVENETSSLALVLDFDAELIFVISPIPKEVDDDSVDLPASEMISCG